MSVSTQLPISNDGQKISIDLPLTNIWRVDRESHIDKIVLNNKDKIVMITFSYPDPRLKIFLKRELAVKFPNCCFVLAVVDTPGTEKKYNFIADKGTYIGELKGKQLPFVFFYYDAKYMVNIASAEPAVIIETLTKLIAMANPTLSTGITQIKNQNNNGTIPTAIPAIVPIVPVTSIVPTTDIVNMQNQIQIQHNKLAHEYQIEKMAQQHKLHNLEELQKIQKIKEAQEKKDKKDKEDNLGKSERKYQIRNKTNSDVDEDNDDNENDDDNDNDNNNDDDNSNENDNDNDNNEDSKQKSKTKKRND